MPTTPHPGFTLYRRTRHEVNTDHQRRCYNGCHFSSELRWGEWESLGHVPVEKAESSLAYWRGLNDYAVSQRGEGAKSEFKLVEVQHG